MVLLEPQCSMDISEVCLGHIDYKDKLREAQNTINNLHFLISTEMQGADELNILDTNYRFK